VLPSRITVGESLSSVSFTASEVFRKLCFLKPDTAHHGPDGIQATLLKHTSGSLALSLAQLYQSLSIYLFNSSQSPKEWKLTNVTHVLKKSKSTDVSNHRFLL